MFRLPCEPSREPAVFKLYSAEENVTAGLLLLFRCFGVVVRKMYVSLSLWWGCQCIKLCKLWTGFVSLKVSFNFFPFCRTKSLEQDLVFCTQMFHGDDDSNNELFCLEISLFAFLFSFSYMSAFFRQKPSI